MKKRMLLVFGWVRMNGSVMGLFDFIRSVDRSEWDIDVFSLDSKVYDGLVWPDGVTVLPRDVNSVLICASLQEAIRYSIVHGRPDLAIKRIAYTIFRKRLGWFKNWRLLDSAKYQPNHYDVVIGCAQGVLWEYAVRKVSADRKFLWLDNDLRFYPGPQLWAEYRHLLDDASALVCVSAALRDRMRANNPQWKDKIFYVSYVIHQNVIQKKAAMPVELPEKRHLRLVTVGRYCEQKGVQIIPSIAQGLKAKGVDFEWYVVAPGWRGAKMEVENDLARRGVTEVLHFVDGMSNPYAMMSTADLYVQPSLYEGFGITVSEALCLGKYVVATDIPEFREQITGDDLGLFAKFDVDDFVVKIEEGIDRVKNGRVRIGYQTPYNNANTYKEFMNVVAMTQKCGG